VRLRDRLKVRYRKAPSADNDALAHAMAMVAVPAIFGFLGSLLDRTIGTSPVFLIALAALGVVGSFASAFYRYEARIAEQDVGKPWARRRDTAPERVA
jgi:F0F1-type ATP synthase assembly protein I